MSREKMIEEMAWDLCDIPKHPSIKSCEDCGNKHCHAMYYAERAYDRGYLRQNEDGLTLTIDGVSECFSEKFIASAIKAYKEQQDGRYMVAINGMIHSFPKEVVEIIRSSDTF